MRRRYSISILLLLSLSSAFAATVKTIAIQSAVMKRAIPATLILPDAYDASAKSFPVLYLLHGAGGNYEGWNRNTDIAQLADEFGIIVLCPDGGRTSWYFDSPIDPSYQYETFVGEECVAYMDQTYRTRKNRGSRALSGLSMGGHGALFLALRHPETFGTSVVLSGGVDIRPFPNQWEIWKRLGRIKTHPENWEKYTVINLANELKEGQLALSIDCGEQDFFLQVNRALHAQLDAAGITHNYIEKPGAHNWLYWKAAIKRQMPFIDKQFKKSARPQKK